jgi:26S proteasome regulatory subunit N9
MSAYLGTLVGQLPQHADDINQMKDLHQKKLWHQLTDAVEQFLNKADVRVTVPLVEFYERVVADFASRANQLRLAALAVTISNEIPDLRERLNFLEKVLSAKYIVDHKESSIVLSSHCVTVEVQAGELEKGGERLDKAEEMLEKLPSAEAKVHAALYKAKAILYKAKSDASAFYRAGLQYLAYEQLEDVPESERVQLAFDLSLASLRATEVYIFGDLIEKGIASALMNTQYEWIALLLTALNQGDIKQWQALEKQFAQQLNDNLGGAEKLLHQKASILAVIELIFHKDANNRIVSFSDISSASFTPIDQVEHLIMKALSLGLIKGRIDQTTSSFNVTWVQPRVLGHDQILVMKDRLDIWKNTVSGALDLMESQISPEILS